MPPLFSSTYPKEISFNYMLRITALFSDESFVIIVLLYVDTCCGDVRREAGARISCLNSKGIRISPPPLSCGRDTLS